MLAAFTLTVAACDLPGTSGGGGISLSSYDQKDPKDILTDAKNALKGTKSMAIKFTAKDPKGQDFGLTITGDGKGNATGSITTEGVTAQFISVDGKTYLKGRDFWAKTLGAAAASIPGVLDKIDDNYVDLGSAGDFASSFKPFIDPSAFADCLDGIGTPVKNGTDTVNGTKAVVLQQKDDSGTKLYVGLDSPHYPVRLAASDASKSFGKSSAGSGQCSSSSPTPSSSTGTSTDFTGTATLDLNDFGKTQDIKKPSNIFDLTTLVGG
ncbi:MAG TPA: hypothetical protein VG329_02560 [Candidatus Dormibacteraeota bacterium]|jgi:hypothetical protein|nr:hypothetical protein [Candidatus Dormibacteraeota bacterium]